MSTGKVKARVEMKRKANGKKQAEATDTVMDQAKDKANVMSRAHHEAENEQKTEGRAECGKQSDGEVRRPGEDESAAGDEDRGDREGDSRGKRRRRRKRAKVKATEQVAVKAI
eukprot:gene3530-4659_t